MCVMCRVMCNVVWLYVAIFPAMEIAIAGCCKPVSSATHVLPDGASATVVPRVGRSNCEYRAKVVLLKSVCRKQERMCVATWDDARAKGRANIEFRELGIC